MSATLSPRKAEELVDSRLKVESLLRKETVEDLLNVLLFHDPDTVAKWLKKNEALLRELSTGSD